MVWKAIEDVGDYKVGDIVPDEQAVIWDNMFTFPPVEKVSGKVKKEEVVVEDPVEEDDADDFKKELRGIRGIGDKTVSDILKVFEDKASLIKAISDGEDLPFRDDVVEKLKSKFQK